MQILYEKSFYKDISNINDNSIKIKLLELIKILKSRSSISDIHSIKKMSGYSNYYRIRINDYRLGIKYQDNIITLIRILHRKEIYKYFL